MNNELIGNCIVGQSGGPTSVINASIYGVIRTALDDPHINKVYGAASSTTCCTTWEKKRPTSFRSF